MFDIDCVTCRYSGSVKPTVRPIFDACLQTHIYTHPSDCCANCACPVTLQYASIM